MTECVSGVPLTRSRDGPSRRDVRNPLSMVFTTGNFACRMRRSVARRWTTFTPPQNTAPAAFWGLFSLRRSYVCHDSVYRPERFGCDKGELSLR
jgi:hypothetical protein